MRRFALATLTGLGLLVAGAPALSDDTDIYIGRVLPPSSEPLVMFSVDTSLDMGAPYAGCTHVGSGASLCAPARYFKEKCPTCVLPDATQPLTYFDAARFILRMVLLEVKGVKVGLMLNHEHSPNCTGLRPLLPGNAQRCSNGGYIARGFKSVDTVTVPLTSPPVVIPGPNAAELLNILDRLPILANMNHAYQGKELFFEFFRYLTGQGVYNGHNGYEDYGTDNLQNLNQDNPALDWDASVEVPLLNRYIPPLVPGLSCARIFTVNFMARPSRQDGDSDAALKSSSGGLKGINLDGSANDLSTVIGYLHDVDLAGPELGIAGLPDLDGRQNVTSYFVVIPTPRESDPPQFDRTTTAYAQQGGTNAPLPMSENPEVLLGHLRSIMSQVLSLSTTFVSSSVPVNVFNRTQVLNEVYVSLFQADIAAKPFWPGNVKKLKLRPYRISCAEGDAACTPSSGVELIDALSSDAVAADGRIRNDALTYWTEPSKVTADYGKGVIPGRDGRHVDVGGAGQKIPGLLTGDPGNSNSESGARQLYVYAAAGSFTAAEAGASLQPLSADLATGTLLQSKLLAGTPLAAVSILKYIRGFDVFDADGDFNLSEVRPWLMGDPLHSKPLPINYGAINGHTQDNPAIYIAVGTNQGFLHFIRNTSASGAQAGAEAWAFLPLELLGVQDKIGRNLPGLQRVYGVDGAPSAQILDRDGDGNVEAADGDKVYLYVGLRRGGKAYYALDVTNPEQPRFLWRIDPTRPGFAELGHTFSQPRLGRVQTGVDAAGAPVSRPAVFFGGGYDLNKDYGLVALAAFKLGLPTFGTVGSNDTVGNALYVVDAETGALIWKAVGPSPLNPLSGADTFLHPELVDSVPSTLSIVDTDGDRMTDRIVVGDTGGNLWRADLAGTPSQWTLSLLAKLGRHADTGKLNDRRFFHEPDFVPSRDEFGPFDAVIIGSGDREDPLDYGRARALNGTETAAENSLFAIKDRRVRPGAPASGSPITPAVLADVTGVCAADAVCTAPNLAQGWRIRLQQARGEKSLGAPLTAASRIYFTTYLPQDRREQSSCGPGEGGGLTYAVSLRNGAAVFNYNAADGGSPELPNSAADRFDALRSAGIPAEPVYINVATEDGGEAKCLLGPDLQCREVPGATRFRTFWQKLE